MPAARPMVYRDLVPTFPDPETWTFAHVLRHHASVRPDAVCLDHPDQGVTLTYAEALDSAERVASALYRTGAEQGERVVIMATNSSELVRTWWGTAVGGLVEVPINTNYEGEFLRHQLDIAQARYAVIDDTFAERWIAVAEHARGIEKFWVIETGTREKAIRLLRDNGWQASAWEELERRPELRAADAEATGSGRDLLHLGHHRSVQGRRDAQLAAVLLRPGRGLADPVDVGRRLPDDDTAVPRQRAVHGRLPAIVAGGRAVVRPKFSASRWIDHIRDSGVTVTNFVGVMMDFAWKQPPRADDRDNKLRCVYAAPTAVTMSSSSRSASGSRRSSTRSG